MTDWNKVKHKTDEIMRLAKDKLSRTGAKLKREGVLVQKKLDLVAIRRRMNLVYADLGKAVYEARARGTEERTFILDREEIKRSIARIELLCQEAAAKEKEIVDYQASHPA